MRRILRPRAQKGKLRFVLSFSKKQPAARRAKSRAAVSQKKPPLPAPLSAAERRPRKALGQHFLRDEATLSAIASAAELSKIDAVFEIGPGPGALTRRLAASGCRLFAVELDARFAAEREAEFLGNDRVSVLQADALSAPPPAGCYKLVANIPYFISGKIFRRFLLELENRPARVVVLVQKEVAEKAVDAKKGGRLFWLVSLFGVARIIRRVPPAAFSPPPKVESAVLVIEPHRPPLLSRARAASLLKVISAGFTAPRKKIIGSLAAGGVSKAAAAAALEKAGISKDARPAALSRNDWQKLEASLPPTF